MFIDNDPFFMRILFGAPTYKFREREINFESTMVAWTASRNGILSLIISEKLLLDTEIGEMVISTLETYVPLPIRASSIVVESCLVTEAIMGSMVMM